MRFPLVLRVLDFSIFFKNCHGGPLLILYFHIIPQIFNNLRSISPAILNEKGNVEASSPKFCPQNCRRTPPTASQRRQQRPRLARRNILSSISLGGLYCTADFNSVPTSLLRARALIRYTLARTALHPPQPSLGLRRTNISAEPPLSIAESFGQTLASVARFGLKST